MEAESQPTNAGGKRVSALMQYLEQKWTGKLEGSSDPRKASRQVSSTERQLARHRLFCTRLPFVTATVCDELRGLWCESMSVC